VKSTQELHDIIQKQQVTITEQEELLSRYEKALRDLSDRVEVLEQEAKGMPENEMASKE
jgi:uncharacterized coiled-coil protein SlyX